MKRLQSNLLSYLLKLIPCMGFMLCFVASSAHAKMGLLDNASTYSAPTSKPAFSGSAGFDFMNYTGYVPENRDYFFPSFMADAHAEKTGKMFDMAADIDVIIALNSSYWYVEAPELFFGTSPQLSAVQARVGRKLENWNKLDELWGFGVFQPRNRWDYLRSTPVGLIGLFAEYKSESFRLVTLGSPVFVPERGLPMETQDGKFVSNNPWFISPSNSMDIFGKETSISYALKIPPIKDIVLNPGLGVQASYGKSTGPWVSGSYMVKPSNQLLVAYDGVLNLANDEAEVTIVPRVVYHQVAGLEAGVRSDRTTVWASGFFERPIRDQVGAEWTTQEISDSLAMGAFGDQILADGLDLTSVQAGYLQQWGGDAPDRGPLSTPGINTFESRYPFKHSVLLGITTHTIGRWIRGLSLQARWINDFHAEGSIMSPSIHYGVNSRWRAFLGADILSSTGGGSGSRDFISNYRANDRVTGGLSYAF